MTNTLGNILLVDDDEVFSKVFASELADMGFTVRQGFGTDVLASVDQYNTDVVILDIVMPKLNGMELLTEIRNHAPHVDVIMLTANATIENAITSMKNGAYDYFTKPIELDRVEQILKRCIESRTLRSQNRSLRNRMSDVQDGQLIGGSPAIREIKELIGRFADSDSTVLIQGESGTGKELVANLIHKNSPRSQEPFIIVDCTALKENLLESELFGHERGAFTGAVAKKHGIFEVADGGTVFLDEIGDISPELQMKLLRVVETRSFRRVGGTSRIVVDVRLIAATNRDLMELVRKGEFREDLYYRINVVNIALPPLRQHLEDIPALVEHFLRKQRRADGRTLEFSQDALIALKQHDWPGNVRELHNVVERATLLAEDDVIDEADLPLQRSPLRPLLGNLSRNEYPSLRDLERSYIRWILEKTHGNKKEAARILKLDRKTILRRLESESDEEK